MKKLIVATALFGSTFFFAQKSENYLQIGYASICCGTPSDKPVMAYLTQFQKKNKIKSLEVYRQNGLGREGEYNLYVGTDKLSKTQKAGFITGLKATINAQNSSRKKNSDGMVNFDQAELIRKADLSKARNLTVYKK